MINVAASSAATAIPSDWYGSQVTFQFYGEEIWLLFGDSSVAAAVSATSGDTRSAHYAADTQVSFFLPKNLKDDGGVDVTHFAHIAASTSGYIVAWRG